MNISLPAWTWVVIAVLFVVVVYAVICRLETNHTLPLCFC